MAQTVKINLNDFVTVRLTEKGYHIYNDYWARTYPFDRREQAIIPGIKHDANGNAIFQLWEFMQIFGDYMYPGAPNVIEPLDLTVELE